MADAYTATESLMSAGGKGSCIRRGEPRRNWCLACSEDRPEDCEEKA